MPSIARENGPRLTGPGNTGTGNTSTGHTGPGSTGPGDTGPGNTGPGNTGPGNTGRRRSNQGLLLAAAGLVCAVVALGAAGVAATAPRPARATTATPDDAATYVDDATCASCHGEIAASFESLGMARSFARAGREERVETFDAEPVVRDGVHERYERRGDELVYVRWQVAADGEPIHRWERRVDWVLGSGSTSRVYLVQAREGSLYELPLAWYSQDDHRWAPTPGTDTVDHEGTLRLVRRECMFCHDALPADPPLDDRRFAPQFFPADLPEGIGCQRCHGPGSAHVAAAQTPRPGSTASAQERRRHRDAVRSTIVDPADLPPARRRDVCAQCHHQPAVALFGQRRLHRDDLDYRPGRDLADFLFKLEVFETTADGTPRPPSERFEINHHAYRFEQSPCFLESPAGALGCTSCHDPHRKPPRDEILATTRSVCLGCHGPEATDEPGRRARDESSEAAPEDRGSATTADHLAAADCVTCHLPRRRTEDIVRVVMTDHRIQRRPAPESERLARRPEREPRVDDVRALDRRPEAATPFDDLLRANAGLRAGVRSLAPAMASLLADARIRHPGADLSEPTLRLATAHLQADRLEAARAALEELLDHPDVGDHAAATLAVVAQRQGRGEEALALLDRAVTAGPAQSTLHFNRGLVRLALGRADACADLERSVELNEFLVRAWLRVGSCREALGDLEGAAAAWSRALALDAAATDAVAPLVAALERLGRRDEARRLRLHHDVGPGDAD